MPLSTGDKLGPYEILSPLGEGGMGQVWKPRDTRLNRFVAIKISKKRFSERFEFPNETTAFHAFLRMTIPHKKAPTGATPDRGLDLQHKSSSADSNLTILGDQSGKSL